jgi:hypothetical protein
MSIDLDKIKSESKLTVPAKNIILKFFDNYISKKYIIEPDYKKSILEKQYWSNILSSEKTVTVSVNNLFRWGSFYITLDYDEKKAVLELDEINLSDYDYELIETWDGGCDFYVDILNEEVYTSEEIEEIEKLLYKWVGEVPEYYDEDDENYDEEKMEANGWVEEDCEYIICTKVKLTEVKD